MLLIIAQQAKLDLELVPKEKRLEIRKCNGRLNPGKTQREPTFQLVQNGQKEEILPQFGNFQNCPRVHGQDFDELPTDEVIVSFFKELGHTEEIKSITDVVVDQIHQPWRTFATIINRSLFGKTSGLDKLRLFRVQIFWGMYYKKNVDYVELLWEDFTYQIDKRGHKKQEKIFVFANKESQIYGARLPESITSHEMRETKAYKTYLGYATGVTPPKKAQKFKKPTSLKLTIVPVSPKEPTRKSKRVKRPAKKSTNAPTVGVVIRDTPVMSLSKKKEKVTVEKRKGIELLSEVALTEEAYNNDHDSSSEGTDQESDSGDDNIQSDNEKGSDSEHETNENEMGFESDQGENEEEVEDDKEEKDDGFVKTPSNYTNDEDETNVESKVEDNAEVNANEGFVQKDGTDAEMINVQQGNENLEITLNQVIEDAHVTISTIAKKTEVLVTRSSHSSDLASKFLNFLDIPHTDAKIVSPMDVYVHHEVPSNQTPTLLTVPVSIITESSPVYTTSLNLEKEVAELKKDDLLNTQMIDLVDEHLYSRLGSTRDEFMSYLSESITTKITEQVKIQLPQILPKEVSNFAPPVIKSMVTESLEHAVIAKDSSQP
ncbi:hypothetical protein Tco_0671214 [Tanacetum coccineum]